VLEDPAVRLAVEESLGDPHPLPLARAVLALVRDAGMDVGTLTWLQDLALPVDGNGVRAAGELLVPGGVLATVVASDAPFDLVDAAALAPFEGPQFAAVGVLDGFAILSEPDVPIDPDDEDGVLVELDDSVGWASDVLDEAGSDLPPYAARLIAVRDLEWVDDRCWPAVLTLPELREPVLTPLTVRTSDGRTVDVTPYTRWWLSQHARLPARDGTLRPPGALCLPGSGLGGIFDEISGGPALADLDRDVLRAIGVRTDLAALLADAHAAMDVLDRLADPAREIPWPRARELYLALAGVLAGSDVERPATVRTVTGVVPRERAVVIDAPDLLALTGDRGQLRVPLPVALDVADMLDVALAGELAGYEVQSTGIPGPMGVLVHDPLLVRDADGTSRRVAFRVVAGRAHADARAGAGGLGRAVAWMQNRWADRDAIIASLVSPEEADRRQAEAELTG
jgi:hypothetical protein